MITLIKSKRMGRNIENDPLTEIIIAACYRVHRSLGPGFSEKVYQNALKVELTNSNIKFETEKEYKIFFKENRVGSLRVDLIVKNEVIVEIKALGVNQIPELFKYQILSYLKVSGLKVGLLVNFGSSSCQVRRFALSA